MKNKILLIQPRNLQSLNNYLPLGLVCIGSTLEDKGYDVTILPTSRFKNYTEIIEKECKDSILVGITTLTTEVPHAIDISEFIKNKYPELPIVWGGWHTTLFPKQTVESHLVDYAIVGDGDELIVQLADSMRDNKPLKMGILRNTKHIDMEKLPMPNYELVMKLEEYFDEDLTDKFNEYVTEKIRWLPYQSSRGCPARCTFCINTVTNNRIYRKKSSKKVLREMEYISKKYKINHLKIIDDNFFVDIKRVREIAKGILKKKLKFTWDVECRTDYFKDGFVDDSTLSLLRKAGCVQFTMGLESGSQAALDRMKKDTTVEQNEFAVKQLDKWDIVPRTSFVADIPGDTKEDLLATQTFFNSLRKYKKFTGGMATYRPYPRSPLHETLVKDGHIIEPEKLMDWKNEYNVKLYGIYDNKKPWQMNYKLSTNMAFYNSAESSVWVREHQLERTADKIIFKFLQRISKFRNRWLFYHFTFDRIIYTFVREEYYKRREIKSRKTS